MRPYPTFSILFASLFATPAAAQTSLFVQTSSSVASEIESSFDGLLTGPPAIEDFSSYSSGDFVPTLSMSDGTSISLRAIDPGNPAIVESVRSFTGCCYTSWPGLTNGWYCSQNLWMPVIELTFAQPVEGFGCWVFDDGFDSSFKITATDALGAETSAILHRVGNFTSLEGFVGAVNSQNGLIQVSIEALDPNGGSLPASCSGSYMIDGFRLRALPTEAFPSSCSGDGGDQMGCTDCPCGNNAPQGTTGGCLNSAGTSAQLVPSGSNSVAASDLRFEATGVAPTSTSILVSGSELQPFNPNNPCLGLSSGVQSVALDGLRCIGLSLLRHGTRQSDADGNIGATTNAWGQPNGFFNLGAFAAGDTRHFQIFHRDEVSASPCGPNGTGQNTSQAISVTFQP